MLDIQKVEGEAIKKNVAKLVCLQFPIHFDLLLHIVE